MTQNLHEQPKDTRTSLIGRIGNLIGANHINSRVKHVSDFDAYASGKPFITPEDDAEGLGLSEMEIKSRLTATEKTAKATPINSEINNREIAGRVLEYEGVKPDSEDWNSKFANNLESLRKMEADKASSDQTPKL